MIYNIVYSSDDNMAPILTVSAVSVLDNNSGVNINLFVLGQNISENMKKYMFESFSKYNVNYEYIEMSDKLDKLVSLGVPEKGGYLSSFSRLFVPKLLSDQTKALYIDCDTICLRRLDELYKTDISDVYCGGVIDGYIFDSLDSKNFDKKIPYINTGVLLMNLEKWRDDDIADKVIDFKLKNNSGFYEQDAVNAVCSGKIKVLPLCFNLFSMIKYLGDLKKHISISDRYYYSNKEIRSALFKPYIVHYAGDGNNTPWNGGVAYRKQWSYYFKKTCLPESVFPDYKFEFIHVIRYLFYRMGKLESYHNLRRKSYLIRNKIFHGNNGD